jgi:hypothetical protein
VAVVLLIVLVWFAPTLVAKTGLRNQILASAAAELNGTLTADDASFGWLSPVELRGIALKDKDGNDVARADRVVVDSTLVGLLLSTRSIGPIRVEKPTLDLVCVEKGTNLEDVLAKYLAAPPSDGARVALSVQLVDGSLTIRNPDRSVSHTWTAVAGEVAIPAAKNEPIRVTARAGTDAANELTLDATIGDDGRVALTGKQVPLTAVGLVVKRFEPTTTLGGTLTTDLTVAWTKDSVSVDGTATAADVEIGGAYLGPDRLRFAKVELPAKFTVKGNTLAADTLKLTCDAGTLSVSGTVDLAGDFDALAGKPGLTAEADLNLTKLAAALPRLFRLRPGTELSGGQLKARVASTPGPTGTVWAGELSTSSIHAVRDGKPIVWDQPLRAGFAGRLGPDRWPVFDKLEAQSDFVGLAARGSAEAFAAAATIDLSRLAERLREFIDLEGVQLAGLADVRLNTKPAPNGGFAVDAKATLTRFAMVDAKGVGLREPELALTLAAEAKKQNGSVRVEAGKVTVAAAGDSAEASLTEPVADLAKLSSGRAAVAAAGNLARWQNRLRAFVALPPDLALNGKGKLTGTIAVANRKIGFDGALTVEPFAVGPPNKPTWTEPSLALATKVEFDAPGDAVRFDRLKVERDGLAADATGSITGLSTTQDLRLDGTLAYDLKKLEPKLKEFLGKAAAVSGADRKPFRVAGSLGGPGPVVTVGRSSARPDPLAGLTGSAAVGWQSVKAYGFDVGPADLTATLDHGTVTFSPVAATFGGGQVRLTPTLDLQPDAYALTFAKGKVIDKAKLTPVACADAIGFVLPAIAKAARAEGTVSLDLAENRVPLTDPTKATMKGTLTLHAVKVSPGPVMTEIATLLGASNVTITLANEQPVGVRVENGRVYHDKLPLDIRGYAVTTSGSVGFDGSLNLVADLPLPSRLIDQALGDRPILKEALAKKRVSVTIGGTLDQPRLDPKAFQTAAQKLTQEALKSAADEALKKGLQGLFPMKK